MPRPAPLWRASLAALLLACGPAVAQEPGTPPVTPPASPGFALGVAEAAGGDDTLGAFYRARDFAPVWTGPDGAARRAQLVAAMAGAPAHALPAERHDPERVRAALAAADTARALGAADVALTRAFLRLARDLHAGVLDPRAVDGNIRRTPPTLDAPALLARLAEVPPAVALREVTPADPEYSRLLRARARLAARSAAGGWGAPVPSTRLDPGDEGPAVVALRDRLMAMGYLGRSVSGRYDTQLTAAVRAAQAAHGLAVDGIAGPATLAALNTPIEERLQAITVALERERWMNIPRGARHVWVNLTDYSSRIVDDGRITLETASIVGGTARETETYEFSEAMTYMEINPDWTIPRGMIARSYLPALQANPHAHPQLQVTDRSGRVIAREAVDFAAHSARSLPYNLRQPPGPRNPLGKVKFMFPNPHAIYLHDTPDRHLFDRARRAMSNGCIRLRDPEAFAHVLLAPQVADPVAEFERIHRSGRQTRVYLDDPVPVHLVYRTAFTDAQGALVFREDVYGRDARVHAALRRAGVDAVRPDS
ncbi:L,D-transpeptidase family protein [Rhodobaculum claviforme]|uniref:L,D-TPase catalytic domain-containing protein n=1 Tax=Rhodobaculum claviforme TaxID=1549854 RepID=A0A934TL70_9RHOB|nr:L,D-transpeptidase family protein [Rhodobaculum claviforme]MBK5927207.1 hypothetical protein [Rhodobaculum claviforme]